MAPAAAILCCIATLRTAPALAQVSEVEKSHPTSHSHEEPTLELSNGLDVTGKSVFAHAGGTWGFGQGLYGSGMRFRATLGRGRYHYAGSLPVPGGAVGVTFDGRVDLAEALIGYQLRRGASTVKGFVGISSERHVIAPSDPRNAVQGRETGVKGALEYWRNIGARSWISADLSYAGRFQTAGAAVRVGRRVHRRLTLGAELAGFRNVETTGARGGALMRWHLGRTDLMISGGVSGDPYSLDDGAGGYFNLGVNSKF